jgi:acyl-CoA thioesterase I
LATHEIGVSYASLEMTREAMTMTTRNIRCSGLPALLALALLFVLHASSVAAQPWQILVFGDSLSYGFDLPELQGFPSALRRKLLADGYEVVVWNGSVPGDTSADALARIATALEYHPDLVIVEFGANDMLQHVDPRLTYRNLDAIVSICRAQGARVILAGMLSLPKNGPNYIVGFNNIYPAVARARRVALYPFFLQGVYGNPLLMQSDNEHPNALGVARIVAGIAPLVEHELKSMARHERLRLSAYKRR